MTVHRNENLGCLEGTYPAGEEQSLWCGDRMQQFPGCPQVCPYSSLHMVETEPPTCLRWAPLMTAGEGRSEATEAWA